GGGTDVKRGALAPSLPAGADTRSSARRPKLGHPPVQSDPLLKRGDRVARPRVHDCELATSPRVDPPPPPPWARLEKTRRPRCSRMTVGRGQISKDFGRCGSSSSPSPP